MSAEENKKIMAENIKRHMERKGVTNQQLCEALGFKYTTFLDWINAVTYPRIGKIEAMANYFGIKKSGLVEKQTMEEQTKKPVNDDELSKSQRMLIDFAKGLTEDQAAKVLQLMKSIVAFDE